MASPDVTVVLSTFNRCASLAQAIPRLLAQRHPDSVRYEIIIVDNNSTDATREVVQHFAATDVRVRYAFEPKPGVSNGRNTGVGLASAPIVAFTDDDNRVTGDWIATLTTAFDEHPELEAVGGRVLPEDASLPDWLDRRHWSPLAILDYGDQSVFADAANPRCLLTANFAIRRDVFLRLGQFSPAFVRCQDHELLLRLWRAGGRAAYLPQLIVYATIDPQRLTPGYHRAWYSRHGRYAARMRLEEVIGADGRLLEKPVEAPRLYGTPGFVYRQLAADAVGWCRAAMRFDRAGSRERAHRVRYLSAYIAERLRVVRNEAAPASGPVAFVRQQLARACDRLSMRLRRW